jgi:alpha-beta hydrolase superfamily lysophospholipase
MGGLLTVVSAIEDDKKAVPLVKGIALVGPLVEVDPSVASPFLKFLARLLCRIFPNFSLSGIDKRFITSDQDWMEKIESDQYRWSGGLKAQHSVVLLNRLEQLATEFSDIKIPMFILHGEEDKICTPAGSQRLHDQAASQDKTLKMYKDAMHNLLLEKESVRSPVMDEIWDWVIQRT